MKTPDIAEARRLAPIIEQFGGATAYQCAGMLRTMADALAQAQGQRDAANGCCNYMHGEIVRLSAEVERLRAPAVPAGWKLVPEYPTSEMIDAGRWSEYGEETSRLREVDDDEVAGVWALMLAASPAAPAAGNVATPEQAEAQAAHDNATLERGIRLGMYRERQRAEALAQQAPSLTVGDEPVAWLRKDGMKAIPADEKAAWIESGKADLVEDYTRRLYECQPAAQAEPVAWLIDWPDEPDLGHYFSDGPVKPEMGRSVPLYRAVPSNPAAQGVGRP